MSGTSDSYAFAPALSEIMLDAYERCGKLGVELTVQNQMLASARRSFNFTLSSWANRGVNLWTVDLVSQFMPQGVTQYFDEAQCVDILQDSVTLRQYLMASPASVAPDFTTTLNSTTVTIAGFADTPIAGGYINVGVMVSVGGIVLDGFYQVLSVPSSGSVTVAAASAATVSVTSGGAVPGFVTTANSNIVAVSLANHGLLAGQTFTVESSTAVGGITLLGPYTVNAGPTTNTFSITAPSPAGFAEAVAENDGNTTLATQTQARGTVFNSNPTDLVLYPISRGDFSALPNKLQEARPTSFWIDRQVVPVINVWPVPDQNGPYELRYRRSRQVQDADIVSGQQLQVPYRMLEPFVADLAAALAQKHAVDRYDRLAAYAAAQWAMAAAEDTEKVSTFIRPDLSSFYAA